MFVPLEFLWDRGIPGRTRGMRLLELSGACQKYPVPLGPGDGKSAVGHVYEIPMDTVFRWRCGTVLSGIGLLIPSEARVLLTFFVVVMVHVPPSNFSRHIAYQTRSKHLPSLQNSVRETWKRSLLHLACFSLWSFRRIIKRSHFLFWVVGVPCYV